MSAPIDVLKIMQHDAIDAITKRQAFAGGKHLKGLQDQSEAAHAAVRELILAAQEIDGFSLGHQGHGPGSDNCHDCAAIRRLTLALQAIGAKP